MDWRRLFLYHSNMKSAATIPNFNLFGEQGDLPDVVHCETIAARSRLHGWELAPHRHARLHQILLLRDGSGEITLDGARHALRPRTVVNVPSGLVHGYSFASETEGLVLTLADEMLDQTLIASEGLRPLLSRAAILPANEQMMRTMDQIADSFCGRDFARAHILRALASLLFGHLARAAARAAPPVDRANPAILRRFTELIDANYTRHLGVAEYARILAVSPTHLTRVTRQATGRPASALIGERVIREARRNLAYTNLSVSRIAYELGFDDPAYFSRVFTRATGVSPRAFRARLEGKPS